MLKLLWKYLKPHKKIVYWCVFLATFSSVISAFIPLVYGRLVDEATTSNPDLKLILLVLSVWLIFVSLANWMSRYVNLQGNILGGKAYQNFLADIYSHYLQLPIKFHKNEKSGEHLNKIDRASNYLWDIVGQVVFYLVPGFLTALVAIVLMYITEWRMTVVLVFILIIYTFATIKKTEPIIKMQKITNQSWEKTWGNIYDSVHNIDVVKAHAKEEEEKKSTNKNLVYTMIKVVKFSKLWRNLSCWQNNIQSFAFVIIFSMALFFIISGRITTGILVTFIGYVNLVFRPFNQLADNYRQVQRGLVTIGRAVKLYDIETEFYNVGRKLKKITGKIEFKNVSFSYDKKHNKVLKGISFKVQAGETIALVGESGTGKTTLLSLISRYYHPSAGKIFLDGCDIKEINLSFLRQQIAIVPQEVSLFNDTLRKNLIYAKPRATEKEIINALQAANAWEFVSKFPKKFLSKVGERGIKLSTGQKQRIAIARALLRDPKILILDEATSALDSISERLVQEALKHLIAGRTTFVIAHRLSTIINANKILVFDKGKLIEQGRHEDLIQNKGVYWNLYQNQKF
ncbi:MAG: ABC transporter ATP-binding protein [Patescibacteria group bacterium]